MAKKKIQLIKPYGLSVKGTILETDAPVADLLVARGVARLVETPAMVSGVTVGEPDGSGLSRRQAKLQVRGRQ